MYNFLSDGAEYLAPKAAAAGKVSVDDIVRFLIGNRPDAAQRAVVKDVMGLSKVLPGVGNKAALKVGRLAGRLAPGISVLGNVGDVADIVAGDESIGNKVMDTAAMGLGGTAGAFLGGPLGASIGASLGKAVSDGTQYIVGGGKSPEERKLEEALAMLNGGRI